LKNQDENHLPELKRMTAAALEQTSFIQLNMLSPEKEVLVSVSLPSAAAAEEAFAAKNMIIVAGKHADGGWIFANKRIYHKTAIPVFGSGETPSGYLTGIYLVSLDEFQQIINRFLLSFLICIVAVSFCTFLCYFGFLLLSNHLIRSVGELNRTTVFLLKNLGTALAKSDIRETDHGARVLLYALSLAEHVKLPEEQKRTLIYGVFLHDIGMLTISPAILGKEGTLDREVLKEIHRHPQEGAALIKKFRWLRNAEQVVHYHHENYDGSGYPNGVKHEKIPMVARIFSIADTFDALTSHRPYKDPLSLGETLAVMEQQTGLQFDPVLLSAFLLIAPHLYETIAKHSSKELEKDIDRLLKRYLKYR
ncbi:MAG: HD domain-containing phosphohydrolase, partial [Desulfocapsaceae bacterium]|nr:HD domain-containing phosphohydrolase [Desulfocapsaceae bacterium]